MKTHFLRVRQACYLLLGCLWQAPSAMQAADTLAAGVGVGGGIDAGVLATWGKNESGQLGHSAGATPVATPALVPGSWQKLALGTAFTMAQDNTGQLFAWGINTAGQLGSGSVATSSVSPVRVANLGPGVSVSDFVAGDSHALALGSDGKVYSWGNNGLGQLGTGDTATRTAPVRLAITRTTGKGVRAVTTALSFRAIAATDNSSFAIATDGTLWAWGSNASGELGTASKSFVNRVPTQVGKTGGWTALLAGARHVIGIQNGKPFVWGDNSQAQLGLGKAGSPVKTPTALKLKPSKGQKLPALVKYAAGDYQSFAFAADGRLYAWGNNMMGQLGVPPSLTGSNLALSPVLVSATERYSQVASGSFFTLLRTTASSPTPSALLSVGTNVSGELGTGTTLNDRGSGLTVNPIVGLARLAINAPDLVSEITTNNTPTFGTGGSFGPLTLQVQNLGTAASTGSLQVSIYLSSDSTLDASDRLLAQSTADSTPLSADQARAVSFGSTDLQVPDLIPGSYFLISQVVSTSQTDLYAPSNGTASQVTLVGPDLVIDPSITISNVSVDNSVTAFAGVGFSLRNSNIGTLTAGKVVQLEAYLSTDAVLQPFADTRLKSVSFTVPANLAAGETAFVTAFGDITVPTGTAGGSYFLILTANRNGSITESGTGTNTAIVAVQVATSDLAVSAPVLANQSTEVGSGTTISSISAVVQNRGASAYSTDYSVDLYLSSDSTYDGADIRLATTGAINTPITAFGGQVVSWTNVVIPSNASGSMFLISRVRLSGDAADRSPANNNAATAITVAEPLLTIDSFIFPNTTSIERGGDLGAVTYRLFNSGNGAISASRNVTIQVWLSQNNTLESSSDQLIDQYTYSGGIAAGGSTLLPSTSRTLRLPTGLANGIYQLLLVPTLSGFNGAPDTVFDPVVKTISVGVLDVKVSAPVLTGTPPISIGVNTTIPITTVTVTNSGGFAIPAGGTVKLYLSENETVDTSDVELGSSTLSAVLAAQTSRSLTFSGITLPNLGQGAYFLVAKLELPSGLLDINNDDNVAATAINMVRPSLELTDVTVANTLNLDTTPAFTGVSFELANNSIAAITSAETITYEVFLSRDNVVSPANDTVLHTGTHTTGLAAGTSATISAISLTIPPGTVGGTYYLIFVANRNSNVALSSETQAVQVARQILLEKVDAPGKALDYGIFSFGGDGEWTTTVDSAASGSEAWQTPTLAIGQTASISMTVYGPTVVRAPWRIVSAPLIAAPVTGAVDALAYSMSPAATTDGIDASSSSKDFVLPSSVPIVVSGPIGVSDPVATVVTWTYSQNSSHTAGFARLDLDLPSYITSGDGSWTGITDANAKVGATVARTPILSAGQQAGIELAVTGPALVKFWWKSNSVVDQDVLSFSVDGTLAQLPTTTVNASAQPATLSGVHDWQQVAFIIGDGPRTLRWNYSQGSTTTTSEAYLDGVEILKVLDSNNNEQPPATSVVNRSNDSDGAGSAGDRENVPESNIDLAIQSVTAPTGTYLLDDAAGTSRLPLQVHIVSQGADFSANPAWSASSLEVRLSANAVFGDSDDLILGNYLQFSAIQHGRQIILNTELNLPFNLPSGNYHLFVRIKGTTGVNEFTLANNTTNLGNGYIIQRAPNLEVADFVGLLERYPYHPEDNVFVAYNLKNTGLGSLLPSQPFKVQLTLMAIAPDAEDFTGGIVVKAYDKQTYGLFLPEIGGQYPNGGSYDVTQTIALPSTRDMLVALGSIPAGTPEDEAKVAIHLGDLRSFVYYFRIDVDTENDVAESSETNRFWQPEYFHVSPIFPLDVISGVRTASQNIGQYIGDPGFEDLFVDDSALNGTSFTTDAPFKARLRDYALARAPFARHSDTTTFTAAAGTVTAGASFFLAGDVGSLLRLDSGEVFNLTKIDSVTQVNVAETNAVVTTASAGAIYTFGTPNLLFGDEIQNSLQTLNVPGFADSQFLTISFDFNVLAQDVRLDVQSVVGGTPTTLVSIAPPFFGTSGGSSLTGYQGLLSNPLVVSVEGNHTDVQKTATARVTVRDNVPFVTGRSLKVNVVSLVAAPAALSNSLAASNGEGGILLDWTTGNPATGGAYSYVIERKGGTNTTYAVLGWSFTPTYFDTTAQSLVPYTYRVRAVSSGGSTAYLNEVAHTLP